MICFSGFTQETVTLTHLCLNVFVQPTAVIQYALLYERCVLVSHRNKAKVCPKIINIQEISFEIAAIRVPLTPLIILCKKFTFAIICIVPEGLCLSWCTYPIEFADTVNKVVIAQM